MANLATNRGVPGPDRDIAVSRAARPSRTPLESCTLCFSLVCGATLHLCCRRSRQCSALCTPLSKPCGSRENLGLLLDCHPVDQGEGKDTVCVGYACEIPRFAVHFSVRKTKNTFHHRSFLPFDSNFCQVGDKRTNKALPKEQCVGVVRERAD